MSQTATDSVVEEMTNTSREARDDFSSGAAKVKNHVKDAAPDAAENVKDAARVTHRKTHSTL